MSNSLESAKLLWDQFGEIPIDEDEKIEAPFVHFDIGAHRYEVWLWFEEKFNLSVAKDLMSQ